MLLRTKPRKLQLGASLNQAQNSYAPIDIKWKDLDLSSYKESPLNIPKSPYGSSGSTTADDGLPSDVEYVNSQISQAKEKLHSRLTAVDAKDYTLSTEYRSDMANINKWAQAKASMLKSRSDDYKTTKARLQKASADDLAMFNGQALAKDNTDGQYKIVDADAVLTERIQDGKSITPKYTPANVGTALSLRMSNPEFSGFNEDQGAKLDKILSSVSDAETVNKEMTTLFSKTGSIDESNSTFTSVTDTSHPHSMSDLLGNLTKVSELSSKGVKTNETNLRNAVDLFKSTVSPVHLDALRNNAIAKFTEQYGNKQVDASKANTWVDAEVDAEIAKRASIYLKSSIIKKSGSTVAGGGPGGTDLSKKKLETNGTTLAQMDAGKPLTMESSDYKDAKDLKGNFTKFNIMGKINATEKPIKENVVEGMGAKATATHLSDNNYIAQLTGNNLQHNLFLADGLNTPVNNLNGGDGLTHAQVNLSPREGRMKILHSMPYTIDQNGNYGIAWKDVTKAMEWGKMVKDLTDKRCAALGIDPTKAQLSKDIRQTIMEEATSITGFDGNNDKHVHVGDIAMIPILVATPEPGYDDGLANILSSNVDAAEKKQISTDTSVLHGRHPYKTYAFTVMTNSPQSVLQPEYYGKADKMPNVTVADILGIHATNQRINRQGADLVEAAVAGAHMDPSIQ